VGLVTLPVKPVIGVGIGVACSVGMQNALPPVYPGDHYGPSEQDKCMLQCHGVIKNK
jgi:hypothetical protein